MSKLGLLGSCQECGCACQRCVDSANLHLHVEIENLKQRLLEREHHIVKMETNFLKEAEKFPNGEMAALTDELLTWQDKYSRLYEAHKRVQKVNQNLEDKLLRIVDKCETEKNTLTTEVATLTRRLVDQRFNVSRLQEENERYRNDVNLAIQLLQCKPSNFVSQKYDSLPQDMQQKVRSYVSSKRRISDGNGNLTPKPEMKTIKVPIPTFPPTAMVYSVNKSPSEKDLSEERQCKQGSMDIVSAAIMAKVLEEREKERSLAKHCDSCTCPVIGSTHHATTQTTAVETCDKCQNTVTVSRDERGIVVRNSLREERGLVVRTPCKEDKGLVVRSSSPMLIRGTNGAKSGSGECTLTRRTDKDSLKRTPYHHQGKWDNELDKVGVSVREAMLVNLEEDTESRGPRHCSVRVQAGSNNILLDNVAHYTPVLYKSRDDTTLVHSPLSRSRSQSGSSSTSSNSLDDRPTLQTQPLRTETQI